jgi:formylglycine-generating enzyme required for sulfatase activity
LRAFILVFAVAWTLLLASPDQTVAQEQPPTPKVQRSTAYLPIIGRAPKFLNVYPADGALEQSLNVFLAWQHVDSSLADPRYVVLLEAWDDTPDVAVANDLARTSVDPVTLELSTTYYWQIIAVGADAAQEQGPVWSFRTHAFYDNPAIGSTVEVPAGEFTMGCDWNHLGIWPCNHWEEPLHKVWLDRFAIDKFEVTNVEYRSCVAAGACDNPRRKNSHERDHYFDDPAYNLYPVIYVSRANALQYCTWAGKRLPTEAEWEKAARGSIDTRPFPWGDETLDCTRQHRPDRKLCGDDVFEDTGRVGLYPRGATPYGAMDMTGNVFEWVYDVYHTDWYSRSPYANPVNPPVKKNDFTVIRGGSYRDYFHYMSTYHRHTGHHGDYPYHDEPLYRSDRVGFRCAMSLP